MSYRGRRGFCPRHKQVLTWREAWKTARQMRRTVGWDVWPYRCPEGWHFHLGDRKKRKLWFFRGKEGW